MSQYKKLDCCRYCLNLNDEECPCLGDVSVDEDYFSCDFHSPNYWKIWNEARVEAIDEFVAFANTLPTVEDEDGYIRPMRLEEMAEQLKEKKDD